MKQLLIVSVALIAISCGSKSTSNGKFIPKADTTRIQAIYIDFSDSLKMKNGIVFEIVRDAINVDSTATKVNKVKDSLFFYRPVNDTLWRMILRPYISTDRNVDTAINRLSRVVDQIKVKDSLKKLGIIKK